MWNGNDNPPELYEWKYVVVLLSITVYRAFVFVPSGILSALLSVSYPATGIVVDVTFAVNGKRLFLREGKRYHLAVLGADSRLCFRIEILSVKSQWRFLLLSVRCSHEQFF